YLCASCGTTLALQDELISKAFSGRDGKAYLFFSILNIRSGQKEDRQLLTGLHTVADLSCATCQRSVGWSYLRAFEASQRYKEGKFILERASLHKSNNWS
ncbi:yippee-like protein, partial [Meira miltonrushii]